jgi:hypothetical protein
MQKTESFIGDLSPCDMNISAQVVLSVDDVKGAFNHISTQASEAGWRDLSDITFAEYMLDARQLKFEALELGADWFLEPLKKWQPKAYAAAYANTPPKLYVMEDVWTDPWEKLKLSSHLYIDINGALREFDLGVRIDKNATDEINAHPLSELLSLPEPIARGWLSRTNGWKSLRQVPSAPMAWQQMIGPQTSGINDVIESYGSPKKAAKPLLDSFAKRFPEIVPKDKDSRWEMRCFLDTRPAGVSGPVGDQFFSLSKNRDGVVYHLHRGDASNLRVLDNPSEAIDYYHEHLFLKKSGEFDFSAWSKPAAW